MNSVGHRTLHGQFTHTQHTTYTIVFLYNSNVQLESEKKFKVQLKITPKNLEITLMK